MAEKDESRGFLREAGALLSGVYHAVMEGGEIQAGMRQGFRELGNAFGQIWPDSIAVTEPGAVFNPLYSDIAAAREGHAQDGRGAESGLTSPAEIAPRLGTGREAVGPADRPLPSPSEIARDPRPATPEPGRGLEHGREM